MTTIGLFRWSPVTVESRRRRRRGRPAAAAAVMVLLLTFPLGSVRSELNTGATFEFGSITEIS
ncbi:hypothetical protein Hanom_Chr12g01167151 [Helianthus anomalus]